MCSGNNTGNVVPRRRSHCDSDFMGERLSSIEIHRQLLEVYGDGVMTVQHVRIVERASMMMIPSVGPTHRRRL